ncbi:MAG: outer membrane beta-barrel protein [Pseudorhodoplanes sp.]
MNVSESLKPIPPTNRVNELGAFPSAPLASSQDGPVWIDAGRFSILPSVTAATFYDDNVFALARNPLGDWAAVLRPELTIRSKPGGDVDIGANAFVEGRRYGKFDSEDQVNGGVSVGATTMLGEDTQIVGRAQYLHAHEDRGVSDIITNRFARPIPYDQGEAALAINQRWDRWWSSVGASGLVIRYADADFNGIPIAQDYRNGNIERFPVRFGYVVAPLTSVFVEASGNRRDFEVDTFDSAGYRVVGGLLFEPGPGARIRGEVYAGYMFQDYNGASFDAVSTWTAGGSLAFLLAPNWTLGVEGRRDAQEASLSGGLFIGGGVSVVESVVTVRTDYRILPNVVIGGGVSYIQDQYLTADRVDEAWSPLASLKYFVNPSVTFAFDYRHVDFNSSGFGIPSYLRNVYLVSANVLF